jgi:Dolichyl-phosphate-mannose-protein mannosyltransferase
MTRSKEASLHTPRRPRDMSHASDAISASDLATAHEAEPETEDWAWIRAAAPALLVGAAIALRVAYYFVNPTLSVDESALALNLIHRSYHGITQQLDFNQAAPLGFLASTKIAISTLGPSEYVLRLLPLAGGILASFVFFLVASKLAGRRTALFAVALFAVSLPLLFYAATAKQYSIDVAVALLIYLLVLWTIDRNEKRYVLALALFGGLAIWFSHPAVFVLTGIASVLILTSISAHEWSRLKRVLAFSTLWGASFVCWYVTTASSVTHVQGSIATDPAAVLTATHGSGSGRLESYGGTIRELLGIPEFSFIARNGLALVGILLCVMGFWALLKSRASHAFLITAPALYVLVASALGKYPLYPRTLLFLVPGLLILLANGVRYLSAPERPRLVVVGAVGAYLALLGAAASAPVDHLRLRDGSELKHAMRYLAINERPGDSLYVFLRAQYDLSYYLECGCFADQRTVDLGRALWPLRPVAGGPEQWAPALRSDPPRLIIGATTSPAPRDYGLDLRALRGRPRVWILIAAAPTDARKALLTILDRQGRQRDTFRTRDDVASVYLYDLSDFTNRGSEP